MPAITINAPIAIHKVIASFNSHHANNMAITTLPLSIKATVAKSPTFRAL